MNPLNPTRRRLEAPSAGVTKRPGRPSKYAEPSQRITVTLPESTLEDLQHIDPDRGRAIVKLLEAAQTRPSPPMVEIVEMAPDTGLLVVTRCDVLGSIPFLHLIEVSPKRFLLALDPGNDFKTLEIAVQDVLENVPEGESEEREFILCLLAQIRRVRKAKSVSMAEVLFVKMEGKHMPAAMHSVIQTVAWFLTIVA